MQSSPVERPRQSSDELVQFMENENMARERDFNESRIGKWWNRVLEKRTAKARKRLRGLAKDE